MSQVPLPALGAFLLRAPCATDTNFDSYHTSWQTAFGFIQAFSRQVFVLRQTWYCVFCAAAEFSVYDSEQVNILSCNHW